MYILTKAHRIHETQAEAVMTEKYADYETALKKLYQYMYNNTADVTVEMCNIAIMNEGFNVLKVEKFTRTYEQVTE